MTEELQSVRVQLDEDRSVSALLQNPTGARACYVFAHGAGADMSHRFMGAISQGLFERGIATLRYQFFYSELGSKRPDSPALAHMAVRAAVASAFQLTGLPLIAGGKSFGGRMTSQAQAKQPLPEVRGLALIGFPLHAPDKPSIERAAHLAEIQVPMLFIQGTRDKLADLSLLRPLVAKLGGHATLKTIEHADHGFDVLVRSGRKPEDVMTEVLDAFVAWVATVVEP
jgi:predicted alpha/beta-hydrolase family hydrolase